MGKQEQKQKAKQVEEQEEKDFVEPITDTDTLESIDELLNNIDLVLEENAEEFIENYIQRGGE